MPVDRDRGVRLAVGGVEQVGVAAQGHQDLGVRPDLGRLTGLVVAARLLQLLHHVEQLPLDLLGGDPELLAGTLAEFQARVLATQVDDVLVPEGAVLAHDQLGLPPGQPGGLDLEGDLVGRIVFERGGILVIHGCILHYEWSGSLGRRTSSVTVLRGDFGRREGPGQPSSLAQ